MIKFALTEVYMRIHIKLLTLLLALLMLLQASAVTIFAFEPIDVDSGIYQASGQPSNIQVSTTQDSVMSLQLP